MRFLLKIQKSTNLFHNIQKSTVFRNFRRNWIKNEVFLVLRLQFSKFSQKSARHFRSLYILWHFFVQGISEKYQSLQVRVPLNILRYPKVAVKAVSSVYLSIEFTNKILTLCFNFKTNIYLKIFLSNFLSIILNVHTEGTFRHTFPNSAEARTSFFYI